MRSKAQDLTGKIFGKQVVLELSREDDRKRLWWRVRCACGSEREVRGDLLKSGESLSCGCWRKEIIPGQMYGRLQALYPLDQRKFRQVVWECKCSCGEMVSVLASCLKNGHTKSCGCLDKERREEFVASRITHHKTRTRIYGILQNMISRCYNLNDSAYKNYGGRGITVCDEWLNNYSSFFDWADAHGYNDTLEIDRINNNGNYTPENCRWAVREEQARNKRSNIYLTFNNKTMVGKDWASALGISDETIYERFRRGLSVEKILNPFNLTTGKPLKSFSKN